MLIDWFTVSAQVINFLILVCLLKRFLYGPILQAMDRRVREIGDRLRDAAAKGAAAEKEAQEYRRKAREVEEERPRRLKVVEDEVEQTRRELLAGARTEVEALRGAWRDSVARERQNFMEDLKRRTGAQVVRIAGKSLAELADAALGQRLVARFCEQLGALSPEAREQWGRATAIAEVTVRSSFELDASLRREIATALREACGMEAQLACRLDPGMPLGVELTAGGMRLSWGLESYFEALEQNVADLLEEQAISSAAPAGEG